MHLFTIITEPLTAYFYDCAKMASTNVNLDFKVNSNRITQIRKILVS